MKHRVVSISTIILVLVIAGVAYAATNGYNNDWWTVDGGGGTSQGGDYAISGTIGQPDTSPLMSGGEYTVVGGFWGGALTPPSPNLVYLPLVIR
jgi:hypothetical protein